MFLAINKQHYGKLKQKNSEGYKATVFARLLMGFLLLIEIVFFIYSFSHLNKTGYLPTPFFYNANDTFADFFHTNFWAIRDGRFEEWKSIYPIIVFAFANFFRSGACSFEGDWLSLRACDPYSVIWIFGIFVLSTLLCSQAVFKNFTTKRNGWYYWDVLVLFCILSLSVPGLYALERGNYIVLSLLFLVLSVLSPVVFISALFLALAINIKQYLILLLIAPFLRQRYGYLSLVIILAIVINMIGLLLVPEIHYEQLLENMIGFSNADPSRFFEKMWNPTAFSILVGSLMFWEDANLYFTFGQIEALGLLMSLLLWLLRLCSVALLLLLFARRGNLSESYIMFSILVCLMANVDSIGGYGIILLFPFLIAVLESSLRNLLFVIFIVLLLPLEFAVGPGILGTAWHSYLGGQPVDLYMRISLSSMLQPIILMVIVFILTADLMFGRSAINSGK